MALFFVPVGAAKVAGAQQAVDMFTQIGAGQWLRYVTGAVEIIGAVGLLVSPVAGLAALGLAATMIGATATHLFVLGGEPWTPLLLLVVSALVAWGCRHRSRALLGSMRHALAPQLADQGGKQA
ncbi:hypothetical protein GCM10022226_03700 [Sphaerisporangium flaviroseum]|uniref:DoxX family protein n=1 Tax=Sphaerisporangium flaviroseum TaxID=509199 RepID=A0ABP7H8Y8_9ACTN